MIHCIFEDGGETALRHATVTGIVQNKQNDILLIKRAPNTLNGNLYGLIGGFLDRDEDTKTCMLRELKEEAGIAGTVDRLFVIKDNPIRPKEDRQNVEFVYIVTAKMGKLISSSEGEVSWFSFARLPKKDEFAFDHLETIQKYLTYQKEQFPLPFIGKVT